MTTSLATRFEADEIPTRKVANATAPMLALATKVDRLATVAIERLWAANDGASIAGAIAAIAEIRGVAGKVLK